MSTDDDCHSLPDGSSNQSFSAAFKIGLKRRRETTVNRNFVAKMAWKNAVRKALALGDPWEKFHLNAYKTERARRHRYNAMRQTWTQDEVVIKMEKDSFNHGAMRECFRMKKLSNFSKDDWERAHNYVAKRYMDLSTPRETYFDDVRLQLRRDCLAPRLSLALLELDPRFFNNLRITSCREMASMNTWRDGDEVALRLLGTPPLEVVDIFQMAILEMIDREGSPLFHLEHFIEGQYVKYNSNSGFVRSEAIRMTPQAFSHFTFERSGHELIVVDIQGVGDLYTDPQIHTSHGYETITVTMCMISALYGYLDVAQCSVEVLWCKFKVGKWFKQLVQRKARPSHVLGEIEHRKQLELLEENRSKTGGSVLGQVHLDLAKYHELNRFVKEGESFDQEAAIYHLSQAAKCGCLEAIKTMAQLHLGLPHDTLPGIQLDDNKCELELGFDYMQTAAEAKDRAAMIYISKAYETGIGLPKSRSKNWDKAVYWLEKVINTNTEDEEGNFDGTMDDPQYQLVARQAVMYLSGGYGLEKDPNKAGELYTYAAELATEAMKGKLAAKYYMQAEEAWAELRRQDRSNRRKRKGETKEEDEKKRRKRSERREGGGGGGQPQYLENDKDNEEQEQQEEEEEEEQQEEEEEEKKEMLP
ncbi:Eukaryotic elongation factor 2 kinase [Portunus trituberculatus]|uniref:Eukaryotic elongation factor 2 kinase n=1 Tax=Portunus trituberculatus TaxID=210409 RepID=A0A5B7CZP4_PORTR|nr:Eukaryotic elongation factor 2 kinase [Portunus trituberculatus]